MKRWLAVAVIVAVFAVGAWIIVTTFAPIVTSHRAGGGPFLTGGPTTTVIVSTHDVPAGAHLDRLIKAGEFHSIEVLDTDLVNGAITSLDQLRGQTTADPIYANEQIPTARLVGIP
jgi:Flp pilus assembly protein CpaB